MFVLGMEGVTEEWKKIRNKELHDLYSSSDIIGKIKSRRMKSARYVARIESHTRFVHENTRRGTILNA
jgi:hypothetical protein